MDETQRLEDSFLEEEDEVVEESTSRIERQPLAKLRVFSNEHFPETEFPLFLGDNVLGRDPASCCLPLSARSVSKRHAVISLSRVRGNRHRDDSVMEAVLWDLGSMNGTRKGRLRLTPHVRYALSEGDSVLIADLPCQYVHTGEGGAGDDVEGPAKTETESGRDKPRRIARHCVSDSDSEEEKNVRRERQAKFFLLDYKSPRESGLSCSTFLTPTSKFVPDSEEDSFISPTFSGKMVRSKTGKTPNIVSDSDPEEEEVEASKYRSGADSCTSSTAKEASTGPSRAPQPVGPNQNEADFKIHDSESDMDTEGEEPATNGTASAGDKATHLNTGPPAGPVVGPVVGPVAGPDQFRLDSDTDVEDEADTTTSAPQDRTAKPPPAAPLTEFHLDSDTDAEDLGEDPSGSAPCESPNPAKPVAVKPQELHYDSDTDTEGADAEPRPPSAALGRGLTILSDSDSDTEEDAAPPPRAPAAAALRPDSQGAAPGAAPAATAACLETDSDTDLEESDAVGPQPPAKPEADPRDFCLDSDTDVEDEAGAEKSAKSVGKPVSSTPRGSAVLEEELETQAFIGTSDPFQRPSLPPLLKARPQDDSQEGSSDEDLVLAPTQCFVPEGQKSVPAGNLALDATQLFPVDPCPAEDLEDQPTQAFSFQLGLSHNSESTQDYDQAELGEESELEMTQAYGEIPYTEGERELHQKEMEKREEKESLERGRKENEEKERLEKERKEREDKEKKEREEKERLEKEMKEAEEKERVEREKNEREEKERLEKLRKEREEKEKKEREEKERMETEKKEAEEKERVEREKKEREEKERLEKLRKEREEKEKKEREEKERLEKEKKEAEEKERVEREEKERLEKEKREREEKERLEKEKKERQEKERVEKLRKEREENERLEKEIKEREEKQRFEKEKKEREEKERLEMERKEREEKERVEMEKKEREEKERLEKLRKEKEEQERLEKERKVREEKERLERKKKEQEEKERVETEKREREKNKKLEKEKEEREEKERLERERLEKEEDETVSIEPKARARTRSRRSSASSVSSERSNSNTSVHTRGRGRKSQRNIGPKMDPVLLPNQQEELPTPKSSGRGRGRKSVKESTSGSAEAENDLDSVEPERVEKDDSNSRTPRRITRGRKATDSYALAIETGETTQDVKTSESKGNGKTRGRSCKVGASDSATTKMHQTTEIVEPAPVINRARGRSRKVNDLTSSGTEVDQTTEILECVETPGPKVNSRARGRGRKINDLDITVVEQTTDQMQTPSVETPVHRASSRARGRGRKVSEMDSTSGEIDKTGEPTEAANEENQTVGTTVHKESNRPRGRTRKISDSDSTATEIEQTTDHTLTPSEETPVTKVNRRARGRGRKMNDLDITEVEHTTDHMQTPSVETPVPRASSRARGRGRKVSEMDSTSVEIDKTGEPTEAANEENVTVGTTVHKGNNRPRGKTQKISDSDSTATKVEQTTDHMQTPSVETPAPRASSRGRSRGCKVNDLQPTSAETDETVEPTETTNEETVGIETAAPRASRKARGRGRKMSDSDEALTEAAQTTEVVGVSETVKSTRRDRGQKRALEVAGEEDNCSFKVPRGKLCRGGKGVGELEERVSHEEEKEMNTEPSPPGKRVPSTHGKKEQLKEDEEAKGLSVQKTERRKQTLALKKEEAEEEDKSDGVDNEELVSAPSSEEQDVPQTPTGRTSRKRTASSDSPAAAKTPRRSIVWESSPGGRSKAIAQAHKVLFTGVTGTAGEAMVARLGGSIAKGVNDMTHLVTDKVRRTVKFLCAVARGVPIVTTDWLEKSGKRGSFLPPSEFLVKDAEQEKKFSFSLEQSLHTALSQPLLQGYEIHVTRSVKPEPAQMKDIISCGGARYLPKMPSMLKPQTLVVSCEEDAALCAPALSAAVPVVSAEFLLTGILQQRADPLAHALSGPAFHPGAKGGAKGRRKK